MVKEVVTVKGHTIANTMDRVASNYIGESMNDFEVGLERYYSPSDLKAIRSTVIGIAGAGGLGSNCAAILTRCGFRYFIVADHDVIDGSNLNRQHYFINQIGVPKVEALVDVIRSINPDVTIEAHQQLVDTTNIKDLFLKAHILVEAFDTVEAKQLFFESFHNDQRCRIMASGVAGVGYSDDIVTKRIGGNCYIVGDELRGIEQNLPLAPRVMIAAAKQADIVLAHVLSECR